MPRHLQKNILTQIADENGVSRADKLARFPATLLPYRYSCSAHGLGATAKHSLDVAAAEAPIRLRLLATCPKRLRSGAIPRSQNAAGRYGPSACPSMRKQGRSMGSESCQHSPAVWLFLMSVPRKSQFEEFFEY